MEHAAATPDVFKPDVVMALLTWGTFLVLLVILKKFAWKPILDGLDARAKYIRESLEEADKVKAQLAQVEEIKAVILEKAKAEASRIIQESRQTASAVASDIEAQARKHANDIVASAKSQIEGERQRVTEKVTRDAVEVAIKLAEKVLEENLDAEKNRKLIAKAIDKDMNA